jgi:hypothetical protein
MRAYVVSTYVEWGEESWIVGVYSKASKAMLAERNVAYNLAIREPRRDRGHYWDVTVEMFPVDEVPCA